MQELNSIHVSKRGPRRLVMCQGSPLQWCHNGCDSISNHQPHHCLLNRLFGRRSKKPSKLRVTGLCVWNSPVTGEFPTQKAINVENVSIWWRHHGISNFNPTLYNGHNYLSMLGLMLNHVSKRGHRWSEIDIHRCYSPVLINLHQFVR